VEADVDDCRQSSLRHHRRDLLEEDRVMLQPNRLLRIAALGMTVAGAPVTGWTHGAAASVGTPSSLVMSFNAAHGESAELIIADDRRAQSQPDATDGTPLRVRLEFLGPDGRPLSGASDAAAAVVVPRDGFARWSIRPVYDARSNSAMLVVDDGTGPVTLPGIVAADPDGRIGVRANLICTGKCPSTMAHGTQTIIAADGRTTAAVVVLAVNAIRDRGTN
jgi:hypothetical protein